MLTSRVASDLAQIMVPIGVVGAVLAVLCAAVAAVAIVRGASGLIGGALGLWIPSAVISSVAGFASQWTPLLVAGIALVAMLVAGAVVRAVVRATGFEWPVRSAEGEAAVAATPGPAVPALTRPVPVHAG